MEYSYWSIILVAFKFISYLSVAALAGGLTIQYLLPFHSKSTTTEHYKYLRTISNWQIAWLIIGLFFTLITLPIEAAALSDTGFKGLFNGLMINIVWQSAIGTQTMLRVIGFILALTVIFLIRKSLPRISISNQLTGVISVLLIAGSFVLTGHSVSAGWVIQVILGLHVTAMSIWIGSLWPLYKSSQFLKPSDVKHLMVNFGRLAVVIVLILLVCGVIMLFQFIDSIEHLFNTGYGQLMLLKLSLVAGMLVLAAWHKLITVPKLLEQQNGLKLKRSIGVEALISIGVLAVTSIFTSWIGPS